MLLLEASQRDSRNQAMIMKVQLGDIYKNNYIDIYNLLQSILIAFCSICSDLWQ
jgi:hypothetical protein